MQHTKPNSTMDNTIHKISIPQCHDKDDSEKQREKLPILHIITSVLAAAIGVQSKKNQEKDFNHKNSMYIYITAGIIFTVAFVLTVAYVVKMVLANTGI